MGKSRPAVAAQKDRQHFNLRFRRSVVQVLSSLLYISLENQSVTGETGKTTLRFPLLTREVLFPLLG
jgi:hypothetical protein